jgi:signal transduction histidine kinase
MTSAGDALRTEIADNGCAFSTEEKFGGKPTGRLGLLVMQERVRNVNGTFSIESKTGRGTRILVQIPMSHPAGPSDPGQILIPLTPAASLPAPETYENHIRTAC